MTQAEQCPNDLGLQGSNGDEAHLWQALKSGDASARLQLFDRHYAFARRLARRRLYNKSSGSIELADLCQLASAGLLEAIDRYDPSRGAAFRTFAARRIDGSILDGLAKTSELREQQSFRKRMRSERARSLAVSEADAEDMPAADALAALIEAAVGLAIGFMLEDTADYVAGEPQDSAPSAYESLVWKDALRRLTEEIANLPTRDASIIRQHYLQSLSFDQIGTLLGISKGRVSQLHRGALSLLRKRLSRSGEFRLER